MNKEQLRMQMLAGIITEGQYKEKMEEVDSMGKIGNSYPAPKSMSSTTTSPSPSFTPEQKEKYQEALIKKFYQNVKSDDEYEAKYNLSNNNELIIANILSGLKPLTDDWYAEIGDWDMGDENDEDDKNHPTYILKRKGYDFGEIKDFMEMMLNNFEKGSTNNPKIKAIQKIIQSYN